MRAKRPEETTRKRKIRIASGKKTPLESREMQPEPKKKYDAKILGDERFTSQLLALRDEGLKPQSLTQSEPRLSPLDPSPKTSSPVGSADAKRSASESQNRREKN